MTGKLFIAEKYVVMIWRISYSHGIAFRSKRVISILLGVQQT